MTTTAHAQVAVVTGGSAGLGRATVRSLAGQGWHVVTDARDAARLASATRDLPRVVPIAGDVTSPLHREDIAAAVTELGRLDLLVHNASDLGLMLPWGDTDGHALTQVLETNLLAPLALSQRLLPTLRASAGTLVGISSDAAVEHYPTWGTYGASKAALDHLILTLGEENGVRAFAVDPGDMLTEMHQRAFPGEDISDRPHPAHVAPRLVALMTGDRPSGRYRLAEVTA